MSPKSVPFPIRSTPSCLRFFNNSAALSALQSLQMTQQSLNTVQNQVSTGLSVATASDNSSYWSIAAQLNSDSGVVTASQSALSEGQSVLRDRDLGDQFGHHDAELDGDRADPGAEPGANHQQHQHLARLARLAAYRRGQRRLIQRPERPQRHPDGDELRLRLQRQRHGRFFEQRQLQRSGPDGWRGRGDHDQLDDHVEFHDRRFDQIGRPNYRSNPVRTSR